MEQNFWWVGNLGEAAALVLQGHQVQTMRPNPYQTARTQTQFGFERIEAVVALGQDYRDKRLMVNAALYYQTLAELRKQRREFELSQEALQQTVN